MGIELKGFVMMPMQIAKILFSEHFILETSLIICCAGNNLLLIVFLIKYLSIPIFKSHSSNQRENDDLFLVIWFGKLT